jgi:hypothetical protein
VVGGSRDGRRAGGRRGEVAAAQRGARRWPESLRERSVAEGARAGLSSPAVGLRSRGSGGEGEDVELGVFVDGGAEVGFEAAFDAADFFAGEGGTLGGFVLAIEVHMKN